VSGSVPPADHHGAAKLALVAAAAVAATKLSAAQLGRGEVHWRMECRPLSRGERSLHNILQSMAECGEGALGVVASAAPSARVRRRLGRWSCVVKARAVRLWVSDYPLPADLLLSSSPTASTEGGVPYDLTASASFNLLA
jgi:hypothetical protein